MVRKRVGSARAVPRVHSAVEWCTLSTRAAWQYFASGVATRAPWRGAADPTLESGAVEAAVCAILPDRDLGPRPIIVRLATVEE